MDGNHFYRSMSESELAEFSRVLSPGRVSGYRWAVGGDARTAIQLHAWNTKISGAFYGPLQTVELALRNIVHQHLSLSHGSKWLQSRQVLNRNELIRVEEARAHLTRKRRRPTPDRLVAELNFGFWVALFAKRYDALWHTDLHRGFTPTPTRRALRRELEELRNLRNRIAHHESIHHLPLAERHDGILWVLGMISPVAADWVDQHSRVPGILADPNRSADRL